MIQRRDAVSRKQLSRSHASSSDARSAWSFITPHLHTWLDTVETLLRTTTRSRERLLQGEGWGAWSAVGLSSPPPSVCGSIPTYRPSDKSNLHVDRHVHPHLHLLLSLHIPARRMRRWVVGASDVNASLVSAFLNREPTFPFGKKLARCVHQCT